MQKKKEEIDGFKLFVIIVVTATNAPIVQAPLSPKNICAVGKLNLIAYSAENLNGFQHFENFLYL